MSDKAELARLRQKFGATPAVLSDKEDLARLRGSVPVTGMDRARSAVQGYTAGFSDEIGGAYRAVAGDWNYDFGEGGPAPVERPIGERYKSGRDEIRGDLDDFRNKAPAEALAWELGGAAIPAVATGLSGLAPKVASTAGLVRTGAGLGALGGAGYSEGETAGEIGKDILIGSGVGAAAGPVIQGAGQLATAVANRVRASMGSKPAAAVVKELQRLAKDTGKTVDDIVDDISNGRVMSENQTLNASIRAMRSEGGEAGEMINDLSKQRREFTRERAGREIRKQLTNDGDLDENLLRQAAKDDRTAWEIESKAYGELFDKPLAVPAEIADDVLAAANSSKKVKRVINEVYQARGSKPLFASKDGALELTRAPTLEDAEMARRVLRDQATAAFMPGKGKGAVGEALGNRRMALETKLNAFSPDLENARVTAQNRRGIVDAFNDGRKALSQDVDEVEMLVEKYAGQGDDIIEAFRRGVAQGTKGKSRKQQNIMAKLADPSRQEGAVMEAVLDGAPGANTTKLFREAETANIADWNYNKLLNQSPTSDTILARDRLYGAAETLADTVRLGGNDPTTTLRFFSSMMDKFAPKLNDEQRKQVVKTLFSTDPQLVKSALTDPRAATEVQSRISQMAGQIGAMQTAPQVREAEARGVLR